MAAPNPYAETEEDFDPTVHWGAFINPATRSYTGQTVAAQDPADYMFGTNGGEVSLQGVIDAKRIRGCARYFLGYNNMSTTAYYSLQRTNPICHPRFTQFVCNSVAFHEFSPIRKNAPTGSRNSGLQIIRNDDTTGVVAVTEAGAGSTPHTFTYYTGYEKAHVTARFTPAKCRYLPDAPGLKEYQRNTIIDTEPRTEVLTLSGAQITFAEGGGNTAPRTNALAKVAPSDIFQVLIKPDLKISWFDVPEKYLSKNSVSLPGQFYPEKIVNALGTINRGIGDTHSDPWLGNPQGVLLLVGAHITRRSWCLAAGGNGIDAYPANIRESQFSYDVELLMSRFKPQKGFGSDVRIVNVLTEGHNCQPYSGVGPGVDDPNAGQWFYATYSGLLNNIGGPVDAASQGIYRYSNFDNIFDSVWNPDLT